MTETTEAPQRLDVRVHYGGHEYLPAFVCARHKVAWATLEDVTEAQIDYLTELGNSCPQATATDDCRSDLLSVFLLYERDLCRDHCAEGHDPTRIAVSVESDNPLAKEIATQVTSAIEGMVWK